MHYLKPGAVSRALKIGELTSDRYKRSGIGRHRSNFMSGSFSFYGIAGSHVAYIPMFPHLKK